MSYIRVYNTRITRGTRRCDPLLPWLHHFCIVSSFLALILQSIWWQGHRRRDIIYTTKRFVIHTKKVQTLYSTAVLARVQAKILHSKRNAHLHFHVLLFRVQELVDDALRRIARTLDAGECENHDMVNNLPHLLETKLLLWFGTTMLVTCTFVVYLVRVHFLEVRRISHYRAKPFYVISSMCVRIVPHVCLSKIIPRWIRYQVQTAVLTKYELRVLHFRVVHTWSDGGEGRYHQEGETKNPIKMEARIKSQPPLSHHRFCKTNLDFYVCDNLSLLWFLWRLEYCSMFVSIVVSCVCSMQALVLAIPRERWCNICTYLRMMNSTRLLGGQLLPAYGIAYRSPHFG